VQFEDGWCSAVDSLELIWERAYECLHIAISLGLALHPGRWVSRLERKLYYFDCRPMWLPLGGVMPSRQTDQTARMMESTYQKAWSYALQTRS
jgi:hypothetical protein